MANKYLLREDAPFGDAFWNMLDNAIIGAAKSSLSARRIIGIEGSYGLGLKSVPLEDNSISDGGVRLSTSNSLPISLIESTFTLSARDIANFEESGFPINLESAINAACAIAAKEDSVLFNGIKELKTTGLLNIPGTASTQLGNWTDVGAASNDIIKAVTDLDNKGFHGPYVLALNAGLYNQLYRLYPNGNGSEIAHIESIIGSKIVKSTAIAGGGILMADGIQFASIIIGQDMAVGYVGPSESDFEFKIFESIALRVRVPSAVYILK